MAEASRRTRGSMRVVALLAAFGASACAAVTAHAQTQLPGITVTTPSPVTPSAPPAQAPAAAPQSTPAAPDLAGTGLRISPDTGFAAVTVMTPAQLLGQPSATLGDAIATQPGISATTFAPGASRPVIRGLSGFRVRIQENGIGSGDVSALSDDHAVPIDPLAAGQVEVVRGPATLRYGSQAIGGVVNAVNNRIPTTIPINGVVVETRGGFSTVDDGRNGAAIVEAGAGNFVVHADTFARSAGDYGIPGGTQANTSYTSEGYSLGGSFVFKDGFLGVAYSSFDSTYYIPGIEAAASKNHIVLNQTKLTSRGEWRVNDFGLEAIRFWFGATDYKHDEVDSLPVTVIGSTFLQTTYEACMEVQHLPVMTSIGVLRGAVGMQWSSRDLQAAGADGILLAPTSTQSLAGFVFEELQVTKKLRFQAAARIESDAVNGTASTFPPNFLPPPDDPTLSSAQRNFTPKSVSAGVLYDLPYGVVARVTGQHVERAPDATELFYKGPHDSTATFEIGNPNLTIEAANTYEIGFKRAKGDFRFDVSVYHTDFKNFIYKRFTGAKCDDTFASCAVGGPGEFNQIVYSQQNATFDGAEVLTEYDIARIWRGVFGVEGQYDYVHAVLADGTYVPKMPPHRLGGGIYYRDKNWLARVNLLHAFAQHEFATFDTPTPGYNLLNAELSYTTKLDRQAGLVPEITVGIRGENLLNDDIRNSVSYKKDEVLQPGMNVRMFGAVKLN
jgi:iron complex outermembrane recepter protein